MVSSFPQEMTEVIGQSVGGVAYDLICAIVGLVIVGMAANEWRRLGSSDYGRMAVAAGVLLAGRLVRASLSMTDWSLGTLYLEGLLQALTLSALTWGYLYEIFSTRQRARLYLIVVAASMVGLVVTGLVVSPESFSSGLNSRIWLIAVLLLSAFALGLWIWHRQRLSRLLGVAFLISLLSAVGGLLGFQEFALLGHLAILPLFAMETYRMVLADLVAYRQELKTVSEQALSRTQDMAFLLEVNQSIVASLDLPVVLERVSESVARAVNADWAYILLPLENSPEALTVAARYGWWGRRWMQDRLVTRRVTIHLRDYSLLRHAALRRQQVLANEPDDYEQFDRLHKLVSRPQGGPTLIQPIFVQGRWLGIVLVGHIGGQRSFSQADSELCQDLASQIATAIDNARHYQGTNKQARRLAKLLRVREEEVTQRQAVLESIADGVVVAGQDGDVILANTAAERILGLTRKQLMGQAIKRLCAGLLVDGGREIGEQAALEWDDKRVMGSLGPVKMPDGAILGHVAVFRDVTREHQADSAKDDFFATVSHELRTTLASIKGYVELLATGAAGDVGPQQHRFLDVVSANTDQMANMVNKLVAVSEMERGAIQIASVQVDMRVILKEAVRAARAEATERQLDLVLDLPPELSSVKGDSERLRKVVDNLLENALRFTPPGGQIKVWAAESSLEDEGAFPNGYLVVSVRDSGVGIPSEEHGRIFEKFYQVEDPLSPAAGGSGVGLAIVKSFVEAHGGRVWVESQVGEGSTFSFVLPAAST